MIVYYCLFFILVALAFLCHKNGSKRALRVFFVLSWILLSVVEGLRAYDVGTDTHLYVGRFMGEDCLRPEIGYKIFEAIVKLFTSNPTIFLIILALLINGIILAAIYFNSRTPVASVLLYMLMYYYFNTYNTARQYIAVAISLIAFYFAVRRKWFFFALMIALAMCFHSTSMVCIVLAAAGFVRGKDEVKDNIESVRESNYDEHKKALRIQTLVVLLTVAASLACYFLLDDIIAIAVTIFPKYAYYLTGKESYLLEEGGGISQPVVYTSILLALLIFVPAENRYKRSLLVPACVAVIFSFLQMRVLHAARFLWYFDIYSVMTIPCILKYGVFPEKLRKAFVFLVSIICFAFMSYYLYVGMQGVEDYRFVFSA